MTIDSEAVKETLQKTYSAQRESNFDEYKFYNWAANRQRYRWETTLESIHAVGGGDLEDVMAFAEWIERIGAGQVVKSARGKKPHITWTFRLDSIGKVARSDEGAELIGRDDADGPELSDDDVRHEFVLRPGKTIKITLPADITAKEAQKLGDFVKLLSFEPSEL